MIRIIAITIFSFLCFFGSSQNKVVHESSEIEDRSVTNPIIHPNPSYGRLEVNLSKYSDTSFEIVIKNIIGKKLWSEMIYSKVQMMDLSFLSKGSYLMSIKGLNGETLNSFRLVIIDP